MHPATVRNGWRRSPKPGVRRRAELYYQQFDALAALRQEARRELLHESRKHFAMKLLRQIPSIGPIRAALLIALIQTPHRFRTKRQLWSYMRFGVEDLRAVVNTASWAANSNVPRKSWPSAD